MRALALVLGCLACVSQAPLARATSNGMQTSASTGSKQVVDTIPSQRVLGGSSIQGLPEPLKALTALLLTLETAAYAAPCRAGPAFNSRPTLTKVRPVVTPRHSRFGRSAPTMTAIATEVIKMQTWNETQEILKLVSESSADTENDLAALDIIQKLAATNKNKRASRDMLLRDDRYDSLVDTIIEQAPHWTANDTSNVLWSLATLRDLPPRLLMPMLKGIAAQLEKGTFEATHLATVTWALSRLETKPVKLLEQIEDQACTRIKEMTMNNCDALLIGFSKLEFIPLKLLPKILEHILTPEMLETVRPIHVSELSRAFEGFGEAAKCEEVLLAIAKRCHGEFLEDFTSRQLVNLISACTLRRITDQLPEGLMAEWVDAVRKLHAAMPMLWVDMGKLERILEVNNMDTSWIQRSAMLHTWSDLALGQVSREELRDFTDDEMKVVFNYIDTDSSGNIDRTELKTALQLANPDVEDAVVDEMVAFGDVDGDNEISFWEFKRIILTSPPTDSTQDKKKLLSKLRRSKGNSSALSAKLPKAKAIKTDWKTNVR